MLKASRKDSLDLMRLPPDLPTGSLNYPKNTRGNRMKVSITPLSYQIFPVAPPLNAVC
jgi:hypothetical protein